MMILTVATLIAAGVGPSQARAFIDPLKAACALFDISTPARMAGFVAQCRVESTNFTRLEEGLFYTTPERIRAMWPSRVSSLADAAALCRNPKALANRVYNGRMGNRAGSDDGWHFRGRGPKQITGRDNYTAFEKWLHDRNLPFPIRTQPEALLAPEAGALSAAWFWKSHNLDAVLVNYKSDGPAVIELTRRINGGQLGLDHRRELYDKARQLLA
jgi:putative chitinase